MITPNIIKAQLFQFLPVYTDRFCDIITASPAIVRSGVIDISEIDHGLETDDVIVVTSAIAPNVITNATFSNGRVTFTTTYNHDLSSVVGNDELFDYNTATLIGFADSNFNGDFPIIDIPAENQFVIVASAAPSGGIGRVLENRNLFISPAVVTKDGDDSFSIPDVDTGLPPNLVFETLTFVKSARIYVAATVERAKAMYTRVDAEEDVLFIVMQSEVASKNRQTESDAILTAKAQNPIRLKYLPEVTFFVFIKTPDDLSGAAAQEAAFREIRTAIRKAMYAHIFLEENDDSIDTQFAAIESANSPEEYDTAVYVHSYTYQIPYEISFEQGDTFRTNVSLRSILINSTMFDTEGALVSANIAVEA